LKDSTSVIGNYFRRVSGDGFINAAANGFPIPSPGSRERAVFRIGFFFEDSFECQYLLTTDT